MAGAGFSSSQRLRPSPIRPWTTGWTSELTSLSLVCEENLGSGILTESTQVRPSRASSPDERHLLALGDAALLRVGLDAAGQRRAQAGEVGAAVTLRDVVGEAQGGLVIAVVPLQRRLDLDAVALAADQ